MAPPKKYNYDIKEIESLENQGLSLRAIGKKLGIKHPCLPNWVKRNYDRKFTVKYIPKRSKLNENARDS